MLASPSPWVARRDSPVPTEVCTPVPLPSSTPCTTEAMLQLSTEWVRGLLHALLQMWEQRTLPGRLQSERYNTIQRQSFKRGWVAPTGQGVTNHTHTSQQHCAQCGVRRNKVQAFIDLVSAGQSQEYVVKTTKERIMVPSRTSVQIECRVQICPLEEDATLTFEPDVNPQWTEGLEFCETLVQLNTGRGPRKEVGVQYRDMGETNMEEDDEDDDYCYHGDTYLEDYSPVGHSPVVQPPVCRPDGPFLEQADPPEDTKHGTPVGEPRDWQEDQAQQQGT
ncbi:hypothetical protein SKAU_G00056340 [Synaphobranchus kaupii]|uniref:Uncharacterized protein n=1 Tax=Synaphobranchus kaupii TaxID=118154 RepID=A0A9Q1G523_SYNKA|nr:hypothetical protein SKAU_G00056340 [Synaphobranchus kaupii]